MTVVVPPMLTWGLVWLKVMAVPTPEALTVTDRGRQAPPEVQTSKVPEPALIAERVMMLPLREAWKMLPGLEPKV